MSRDQLLNRQIDKRTHSKHPQTNTQANNPLQTNKQTMTSNSTDKSTNPHNAHPQTNKQTNTSWQVAKQTNHGTTYKNTPWKSHGVFVFWLSRFVCLVVCGRLCVDWIHKRNKHDKQTTIKPWRIIKQTHRQSHTQQRPTNKHTSKQVMTNN